MIRRIMECSRHPDWTSKDVVCNGRRSYQSLGPTYDGGCTSMLTKLLVYMPLTSRRTEMSLKDCNITHYYIILNTLPQSQ